MQYFYSLSIVGKEGTCYRGTTPREASTAEHQWEGRRGGREMHGLLCVLLWMLSWFLWLAQTSHFYWIYLFIIILFSLLFIYLFIYLCYYFSSSCLLILIVVKVECGLTAELSSFLFLQLWVEALLFVAAFYY